MLGADGTGYVSDVIEAIDWAIQNTDRYDIRVINLSLGHPAIGSYIGRPAGAARWSARWRTACSSSASAGNFGKIEDGTPIIGGIVSPGYTPGR